MAPPASVGSAQRAQLEAAHRLAASASRALQGDAAARAWAAAGAHYESSFRADPQGDLAATAALSGAEAFTRAGRNEDAQRLLASLVSDYGSERVLDGLERGEPKGPAPVAADASKLAERKKQVEHASQLLRAMPTAPEARADVVAAFECLGRSRHFDDAVRRSAWRAAMAIHSELGSSAALGAAQKAHAALRPDAEERAEADYVVAEATLRRRASSPPDSDASRADRLAWLASLEAHYRKHKPVPEAAPSVVRAAHAVASIRRAANDAKWRVWCEHAVKAFEIGKRGPAADRPGLAMGSVAAEAAAECAYRLVDEDLVRQFDYDTGHRRYAGRLDVVQSAIERDVLEASQVWQPKLMAIVMTYGSPRWAIASRARIGSLYDSCRRGLASAPPDSIQLYTEKEDALLRAAETSGNDDLILHATSIRKARVAMWDAARERNLEPLTRLSVQSYAEAVLWAKALRVDEGVAGALARLMELTRELGNERMRHHLASLVDPSTNAPYVYVDDAFVSSGSTAESR